MSVDVTLRPPLTRAVLLERAILETLAYADVFDYPLTFTQVHRYLCFQRATLSEVARALDEMVESNAVMRAGECFVLPGRDSIMSTRHGRAEVANNLWRKAARYSRIIASLPFVRMVAITGSLAMDNTSADKDIDLFVVSAPGRLWTCRALAILVTRLAALERVTLCPNYIVTTNALEFSDHSLYVAHEVAQMVPLFGAGIYNEIRSLNAWTADYLPNAQGPSRRCTDARPWLSWQRLWEAALAVLPTQWFERWEMKRKVGKLSGEQSFNPEAHFSADICKGHADRHGQRTQALLQERLKALNSL